MGRGKNEHQNGMKMGSVGWGLKWDQSRMKMGRV